MVALDGASLKYVVSFTVVATLLGLTLPYI